MYRNSCLAAVIGVVFFAIPLAVPGNAIAAAAGYAGDGANPSDPASMNIEHRRYARGGRGGGRGGGGGARRGGGRGGGSANISRGRASAGNRGARPSNRPSGDRPGGGRPGAGPGGPGGGGNVNINRSANVTVRHRGYGWRGARWGAVVFGVTLGAAIVVAANSPPYPPDPSLCWSWNNAALTSGYWYYCEGP